MQIIRTMVDCVTQSSLKRHPCLDCSDPPGMILSYLARLLLEGNPFAILGRSSHGSYLHLSW